MFKSIYAYSPSFSFELAPHDWAVLSHSCYGCQTMAHCFLQFSKLIGTTSHLRWYNKFPSCRPHGCHIPVESARGRQDAEEFVEGHTCCKPVTKSCCNKFHHSLASQLLRGGTRLARSWCIHQSWSDDHHGVSYCRLMHNKAIEMYASIFSTCRSF